jgi:hypothetical protein
MRETRSSGSEGGGSESNHFSPPLSMRCQLGVSVSLWHVIFFVRLRDLRVFVVASRRRPRMINAAAEANFSRRSSGIV